MSAPHGCCADKACAPDTCRELPAGTTCRDCSWFARCSGLLNRTGDETECDWFPRRFFAAVVYDCAPGGSAGWATTEPRSTSAVHVNAGPYVVPSITVRRFEP
jgi:hypothetical protein